MIDTSQLPGSWDVWSARPELAPRCQHDGQLWHISSGSGPSNHGGWDLHWDHLQPEGWCRIDVACKATGVSQVEDNVRAEVIWWKPGGQRADWAHVRFNVLEEGLLEFVYEGQAPPAANRVTLRLSLRWTDQGSLSWCDPRLTPTEPPTTRKVKTALATGMFPGTSVDANLVFAKQLIGEAAQSGADVVCLPECITSWRGRNLPNEGARPIPGPETDLLCRAAREHEIDVVCSMNELAQGLIYNTGLYVDANQGLLGKYRKVHLAVGERWRGVSPGDEFPVWDTSYGRVGMLICYDNVMGEGHRILSQKGAEVLFMPIMGDPRAVGEQAPEIWRRIMRVRAMDNHVWFIVCRNRGEWGCVIRPDGEIIQELSSPAGVATAEIDLGFRHKSWIGSDYENRYWGERRPHLYQELTS